MRNNILLLRSLGIQKNHQKCFTNLGDLYKYMTKNFSLRKKNDQVISITRKFSNLDMVHINNILFN